MRVGLDVSPLRLSRAGTARYIEGLLPQLELEPELELHRLAFGGVGRVTAVVRDSLWYPAGLPLAARRLDVLHCPTSRAPVRAPVPVVVTVYDLAVLRHPEAFNRWTRSYSRLVLPHVLPAAARLIAISEFTRRELVELLGVDERRVRVIPLAAGDVFRPEGPADEGEYVLAVGTLEPRKNLARLAEATARLGVELRVVGPRGWGGVALDAANVRRLGFLPDEELSRAYRGAACLAYPSLYEGFGIPVLEAMACGTPVVTSIGSPMAEIADGAAELVDPREVDSIAGGIERALARRAELVQSGLERARSYDWSSVGAATVSVYRELSS